jgi:Tol biopolymer transport system component
VAAFVVAEPSGGKVRFLDLMTQETWEANASGEVWPPSLAWSPDGRFLAYLVGGARTERGQAAAVWVVDRSGSPVAEFSIITDRRFAGMAWSPDSRAAAVSGRASGGMGVFAVLAVDLSGEAHRLTGTGNCVLPDWGPARRK